VHLGRAAIKGLKRRQFDDASIDGSNGQCVKRGDLLAIGIAVSRWIKRKCSGERIAVSLPPAVGSIIANIAVTLANKVPGGSNSTSFNRLSTRSVVLLSFPNVLFSGGSIFRISISRSFDCELLFCQKETLANLRFTSLVEQYFNSPPSSYKTMSIESTIVAVFITAFLLLAAWGHFCYGPLDFLKA